MSVKVTGSIDLNIKNSRNWKSASWKQEIKHAPDTMIEGFAYCADVFASKSIAQSGENVTCKCCLKKLRKRPQYANFLFVRQQIQCLGT